MPIAAAVGLFPSARFQQSAAAVARGPSGGNATGLVQQNQKAGAANASFNAFVLRPPAGTFF